MYIVCIGNGKCVQVQNSYFILICKSISEKFSHFYFIVKNISMDCEFTESEYILLTLGSLKNERGQLLRHVYQSVFHHLVMP